jgi:DNA-binding CsgD family transcriptional regulator
MATMKNARPLTYLQLINSLTGFFQTNELTEGEICQAVALHIFPASPAQIVGIFEMHSDGTYSMTSVFGVPKSTLEEFQNLRLSPITPVVDAMRSGKVTWVSNQDELLDRFPETIRTFNGSYTTPIIAIPLLRRGSIAGAIAIVGSGVNVTDECASYLTIVAGIVSLKLQAIGIPVPARTPASPKASLGNRLTSREKLIQGLMARGKTNGEISDDLGYSESTIRQDAISLFSKLGVTNRREAGGSLHDTEV